MKKILIVFTLFLAVFLLAENTTRFVVRIDNPSKEDVTYFYNNHYDIASYKPGEYLDLVVNSELFKKIKSMNYKAYITQTEEELRQNISDKTLSGYRSYNDMLSELQQIVAEHPDICKLYDIGDSWGKIYSAEGYSEYDDFQHDIWLLKISDNVETEEDEPNIFYTGEHHAREPISMEMVMKIIHHIVDNYNIDNQITQDVNSKQIWFIPLINPNGHKLVWDGTDVWWRKNIRDNNENHHIYTGNSSADDQDGVDPNRNYGFQWGNVGASDDWTSETYHGPGPFSEPNTQAVRDFISSHKFVAGISYHSYSELVLFPLGYENNTIAPDHDALQDLAVQMANTIPKLNGGYYTPQESWQLYPCMGTSDDYFYGTFGIFAYTIELGVEFIPPASTMNQITDDNIQAAMILLDRVDNKVLTGHTYDATTNQPISATVYVNGVDNTGVSIEPYQSGETFGRYYRLLLPGSYTVTFSKYGYQSQTFSVDISSDSQTVLDVSLQPLANPVTFSGVVRSSSDFTPISDAAISFENVPLDTIYTNQNGEFTFNAIYEGTYILKIFKDNYIPYSATVELSQDTQMPIFLNEITGEDFENGIPNDWQDNIQVNQWHITTTQAYSGTHSLQSNSIGNNQSAVFSYQTDNLTEASTVSFYHKVSSEAGYDFLNFYIDNQPQGNWSGESDWEFSQYPVSQGVHTLKWEYAKDQYVSNGQDCAWIDMVSIPSLNDTPDFIYYPAQINLTISQNTVVDTFFCIYNNSGETINSILMIPNQEWIIMDNQQISNLASYNGNFVHFSIQPLSEGQYNAQINIYADQENYQIPITINVQNTSSENDELALQPQLENPYPNPFFFGSSKDFLKIKYQIAKKSKTELTIYNIKGQLIAKPVNEMQNAGKYTVNWNLKNVLGKKISSGIYFLRLKSAGKTMIKKISIIK